MFIVKLKSYKVIIQKKQVYLDYLFYTSSPGD